MVTAACAQCPPGALCGLHSAEYAATVAWLRDLAGGDRSRVVFDRAPELVTTSTRDGAARARARAVALLRGAVFVIRDDKHESKGARQPHNASGVKGVIA